MKQNIFLTLLILNTCWASSESDKHTIALQTCLQDIAHGQHPTMLYEIDTKKLESLLQNIEEENFDTVIQLVAIAEPTYLLKPPSLSCKLHMRAQQTEARPVDFYFYGYMLLAKQKASKAFEYFEKAAALNFAPAQMLIGSSYLSGDIASVNVDYCMNSMHGKNITNGISYLKKAADSGYIEANIVLGGFFVESRHVSAALPYFAALKDTKIADVHLGLGTIYAYSEMPDYDLASEHLKKAIEYSKNPELTALASECLEEVASLTQQSLPTQSLDESH